MNRRLLPGIGCLMLGVLLTAGAAGMLGNHIRLLERKRDTALTIGTMLPALKSEVALLSASVAAEKAFSERSLASAEETAAAYIDPDTSPVPRFVAAVQTVAKLIGGADHRLTVEQLTFDAPADDGDLRLYHGHLKLQGSYQDVARFLSFFALSGDMLVRDVLPDSVEQSFLLLVEQSAPTALKDAINFLYTDVTQYAAAPDQVEGQALRDLPVSVLPDVRSLLLAGGLSAVRSGLAGIAPAIKSNRDIWPLPLLTVDRIERSGDRWMVEVTLMGRTGK